MILRARLALGMSERMKDNKCENLSKDSCSRFEMLALATSFKCGNEKTEQKEFENEVVNIDYKERNCLEDIGFRKTIMKLKNDRNKEA